MKKLFSLFLLAAIASGSYVPVTKTEDNEEQQGTKTKDKIVINVLKVKVKFEKDKQSEIKKILKIAVPIIMFTCGVGVGGGLLIASHYCFANDEEF